MGHKPVFGSEVGLNVGETAGKSAGKTAETYDERR